MEALATALNRVLPVRSNASFVQECVDAWPLAHGLLVRRPEQSCAEACVLFFQAFCRWRLRATRSELSREARECGFILTCAARLVLMDALFDVLAADELATFRDCLEDWRHPLKLVELASFVGFTPPKTQAEVEAEVETRAQRWCSQALGGGCSARCQLWSRCSMALTFSAETQGGREVRVNAELLKTLAFYDEQCVARAELRFLLASVQQPALPVESATVDSSARWATKNTANVGDELYARGKECRLLPATPYALSMAQRQQTDAAALPTNYLKILADCLPTVAVEAQQSAADGFSTLSAADVPHADLHKSLCFLNLFDYCMQQLYDIRFMQLFFTHDVAAGVALKRTQSYRKDNIVNPAPLLVLSLDQWWLVYRSRLPGTIERTECYASCCEALCAWLAFVRDVRRSVLFLGKDIGGFICEVCDNSPLADARDAVTLPTTVVE
jgi:hypothetical protein